MKEFELSINTINELKHISSVLRADYNKVYSISLEIKANGYITIRELRSLSELGLPITSALASAECLSIKEYIQCKTHIEIDVALPYEVGYKDSVDNFITAIHIIYNGFYDKRFKKMTWVIESSNKLKDTISRFINEFKF